MKRSLVVVLTSVFVLAYCQLSVAQHSIAYIDDDARWRADVLKMEAPAYPFVAKHRHWHGKGIFHVTIDPRTGRVVDVRVAKTTGFKVLDDSATIALRAWVWKPNRLRQIDVPVEFQFERSQWPPAHPGQTPLPPSPY